MSFFGPRFPSGDFAPLFRLLDDYDVHRSGSSKSPINGTSHIRAFQPKFDVREEKEAYLLNGELPGIDQKDVSIEFTDAQTLIIKGRTEREYSSGTPAVEGAATQGQITEGGENDHQYHKATVEDEASESGAANPSGNTEIVKQKEQPKQAPFKYWVSERSVGEFHRSFTFPGRVDQDAVKASLKNGILNVVVPKAHEKPSRRINIE
ncbi:hypothetical protein MMC13_006688 [Lambiella insularis]|nr:hypothetical protein [Lambiella insularis]